MPDSDYKTMTSKKGFYELISGGVDSIEDSDVEDRMKTRKDKEEAEPDQEELAAAEKATIETIKGQFGLKEPGAVGISEDFYKMVEMARNSLFDGSDSDIDDEEEKLLTEAFLSLGIDLNEMDPEDMAKLGVQLADSAFAQQFMAAGMGLGRIGDDLDTSDESDEDEDEEPPLGSEDDSDEVGGEGEEIDPDEVELQIESDGPHSQPEEVEMDSEEEENSSSETEEDGCDKSQILAHQQRRLDYFDLRIIYEAHRTGFEETRHFPIKVGTRIADRYRIDEYLGTAAFSSATRCYDLLSEKEVCVKIIKNEKDFVDQSLDEIKLLSYLNKKDPKGLKRIVEMFDYFYYKEHLFIVFELLKDNLYEHGKALRTKTPQVGKDRYFSTKRIVHVARQVLVALEFIHKLHLIHCDLKPENIMIQNVEDCDVKLIDFGSSSYSTDRLHSYVQSRSYRAPEIILGLPYDSKIDIWSLGCIVAELLTDKVIFLYDSIQTLLARVLGICGPIPRHMILAGRFSHRYFTKNLHLFEKTSDEFGNSTFVYLVPKRTCLRARLGTDDPLLIDFVEKLLTVDPKKRPSATEALQHPIFSKDYE